MKYDYDCVLIIHSFTYTSILNEHVFQDWFVHRDVNREALSQHRIYRLVPQHEEESSLALSRQCMASVVMEAFWLRLVPTVWEEIYSYCFIIFFVD